MSQLKKGAVLSYVNIILTTVVGLILTPFIVKNLGANQYGLYVLIGSLIVYFSLLDFGIGDTVIRYIARYRVSKTKSDEAQFLGSLLTIFIPIIVFILITGGITYFYIDRIFGRNFNIEDLTLIKQMFLILLFNLSFSLIGNVFLGYINAYEKYVFTRTVLIGKYLLRSAIIYFVLIQGGLALSIIIIDTIINILFFILNIFYCIKYLNIKITFGKISKRFVKEIFSFSIWLFLISLISSFQWQGGQLLLGIIGTPIEIAVYSIGVLLGSYYGAFAMAITTMFLPHASRLVVQNASEEILTDNMIRVGRVTSFVLMLILSGFIIFGKMFVILWLSDDYVDAYYIAVIIMLVYTFPSVQSYANSILEAKQLMRFKGSIYLIFIIVGTCMGYFGYHYLGIIGVISTLCIGWVMAFLLMNLFYIKKLKLEIARFYKEVFASQILPLLVVFCGGFFLFSSFVVPSWFVLGTAAIIYSIVYSVVYYFVVLNNAEKALLKK